MLRSRDYAVAGLILAATVTAVTLFSLRGGLHGSASSEQLEALKVVPQSAAGFMTLEVGALIDAIVDAPMGEVDPKALRKELAEVTRATLGVDLLAIRRATLFASISKKNIGVVLEGDFDGTLQGRAATGALDGVVLLPEGLHAALHGRSLIVGTRGAVEDGFAAATGKGQSLAETPALADAHRAILGHVLPGPFVLSATLTDLPASLTRTFGRLDAAALSISNDGMTLSLALKGEARALDAIVAGIKMASSLGLAELDKELARAKERKRGFSAFALTLAKAKLQDLETALHLERDGDVLRSRMTMFGGLGGGQGAALTLVAVAGALSAVAIPSFTRYMVRAKEQTANVELQQIAKAAAAYFVGEHVSPTGEVLTCRLPESVGPTPGGARGCCDRSVDKDGDGRCDAVGGWDASTWRALNFDVIGQSAFSYEFTSSGSGKDALFTVSAYADFGCEGELTTFQLTGRASDGDPCRLEIDRTVKRLDATR